MFNDKVRLEQKLRIFIGVVPVYVMVILLLYFMWLGPSPSLQKTTAFGTIVIVPFGEALIWLFNSLLGSIPEPKRGQYERRVQYFKKSIRLIGVALLIGCSFVWLM